MPVSILCPVRRPVTSDIGLNGVEYNDYHEWAQATSKIRLEFYCRWCLALVKWSEAADWRGELMNER
jgi:hypothetical protein